MSERIVITGAEGTIGKVLSNGLADKYDITSLSLPQNDIRKYKQLLSIFPGHDAVIHLAWNTKVEHYKSGRIDPKNTLMFHNVYKAALETKVPRVIMASSVHADNSDFWEGPEEMSPDRTPTPNSPYGGNKVGMEATGRYYATRGLEVVCLRFGGINPENQPPEEPIRRRRWLSHEDGVSLVQAALATKELPGNFAIVYAVSDNPGRVHSLLNPFGWIPKPQ